MAEFIDVAVARKYLNLLDNAQKRGKAFDLSFKRVKQLVTAKKCFYTKATMHGKYQMARSIDRVDNDLGYTDKNVVVCCQGFNEMKNSMSLKEINSALKALKKFKS